MKCFLVISILTRINRAEEGWSGPVGMSQSSWLCYCLLEFAYLLSLLMWLGGGSSNQINAFIKELGKDSHKFPLISVFSNSDSKLHVICLFWTHMYIFHCNYSEDNTYNLCISIFSLSSCYKLRRNVVQELMQTVKIHQISSAIYSKNY